MTSAVMGKPLVIGSAIAISLLGVAIWTKFVGTHAIELSSPRTAVLSRAILFRDAPGGGIAVYDEGQDRPFTVLPRDQNTFMATAIRLIGQDRQRRAGAGAEVPFILTRWDNGQLSLRDPATGETLELGAFGHTNAGTFAQLLPAAGKGQ
jgi:putative photosynthetic complex assembly protein